MATPKKLPSGKWRVQVYGGKDSNGKTIRKSITADSKKKCSLLAAQYEAGIREKDKAGMTVREAIQTYIDSKTNILSPATVRVYRGELRTHLQDILDVPVDKLTSTMVQASLNKQASVCSPKSVKNTYSLLISSIKAYDPDKMIRCMLPQKEKKEINIPTSEEVDVFLRESKKRNYDLYLCILIASSMGLRRSEICGLTWDNIHLPFKKLTVSQAKVLTENKGYTVKTTKTYNSNRVLDIPDCVYDELVTVENKTGFLIKIAPNRVTDRFQKLGIKLGMRYRFHDLRHYYASILLMIGIPDKYAMERMGHSTNNMLKTVYQHTFEQKQNDISEQINSFFKGCSQKVSAESAHKSAHEKKESSKSLGL